MPFGSVPHVNLSTRGPSAGIWGRLPVDEWAHGYGGYYDFDDFVNFAQHVSAQHTQKYDSYVDTGCTIKGVADTITNPRNTIGQAKHLHDGTDNDETSLQYGGATGGCFGITATPKSDPYLAFECRLAKSSIADNGIAFFCGLGAPGMAVADTLVDDTGALVDKNLIGFRNLHDNGEEVDFVWKASGQTIVECKAIVTSMTADAFVKLGFLLDPFAAPSKRIKIFVNGTEQSTYGTDTQIAAATFPSAVALAPVCATKIGTASAFSLTQDWWAVGMGAGS